MSAVMGTVVGLKTMADGTVRLTLDMQCSLSELAAIGTEPGTPYGLARVKQQAATAQAQQETIDDVKGGPLSKWAALRCKEPEFWRFLQRQVLHVLVDGESAARTIILELCGIHSRAELDNNPVAARVFREQIMEPWAQWEGNLHRQGMNHGN